MQVWRRISTRPRLLLGRPRYLIEMRLTVDAHEAEIIAQHRLFDDDVYVSPAAEQCIAQAESALDLAREVEGHDAAAMKKRVRLALRGLWSAAVASHAEARASVADVMAGVVFEAADVVELMATESGIRNGVSALSSKIARLGAHAAGEEVRSGGGQHQGGDDGWAGGWAESRRRNG